MPKTKRKLGRKRKTVKHRRMHKTVNHRRMRKTFRRVKKRSQKMRGGNKCTNDEKLDLINNMKVLKEDADNFRINFKNYDLKNEYTKESYDEFRREQEKHLKEYMELKEQNPDCLHSTTVKELDQHMLRSFDIETCTDETKHRSNTGECIEENPYGYIPGFDINSIPPPLPPPRRKNLKYSSNIVEEDY